MAHKGNGLIKSPLNMKNKGEINAPQPNSDIRFICYNTTMSAIIKPFSTTGIGSLPHLNAQDACELVLGTFDIPFWPQLPAISFREQMIPQFSEGMPFIRINETEETVWVLRDDSDQLERFYESCTGESRIAISEDYALGFHRFLKLIKSRRFPFLKGHVTGPITFTLGLKDNFGRLIHFDEELREIACMLLQAKARWQVDQLKQHADNVIIFIDEPILSAIGSSAYLGVDTNEVLRLLKDMVSAVEGAGGIPGMHCCGRADWPLVLRSGIKILNFDAFEYFDTIMMYPEEITGFLRAGGYLACGAVPTSDEASAVDGEVLASLLKSNLERLSTHWPEGLVNSHILLTPACGTGARTIGETARIFQLLIRLKEALP